MAATTIKMNEIIAQGNTNDDIAYFDYDKGTYSYYVKTQVPATKVNLTIFDSIFGQLSDGIWENSLSVARYYKLSKIGISEDNYIVIYYKRELFKNGMAALRYFANKIKQIVKICIDDGWSANLTWDRNCQETVEYLNRPNQSVKVSDAYKVYDLLLQRNIQKYTY